MYCLLLVAIYLVSTSTWLATADSRHYTEAEVIWLLTRPGKVGWWSYISTMSLAAPQVTHGVQHPKDA